MQDEAPQPRCQAETQARTTYRRTICSRHARKTRFAQRPLKTNRKSTAAMVRVSKTSEDGAFQTHFLFFPAVKGCREVSLSEKLLGLVGVCLCLRAELFQRPGTLQGQCRPLTQTGTIQQRELHRGRRGMRHQAAVLPSGHHAAQVGGHQTTGLTGPRSARSLVTTGKGRAKLPQLTVLAALTLFTDHLFN